MPRHGRKLLTVALCAAYTVICARASAEVSEAAPHSAEAFDFMTLLSRVGAHDLEDEAYNVYGQFTYISSWKPSFSARYTNLNGSNSSLTTDAERSFTGTFTLFFGARLWPGAEAYYVPEVIALKPLSGLKGLGGAVQNFELQKTGSPTPQIYRSRAYIQQRISLGGTRSAKESDPMQLGTVVDSRRLVFRVGNYAVNDFFDKNSFAGDLRRQFFNMAFLTYAAYDFVADARGYSWGAMAELDWDDWQFRLGRMAPPYLPNQLPIDLHIWRLYGDQIEVEHDHSIAGLDGAVRVLGYRNRATMGRFDDAVAAFDADATKNAANCGDLYNYGSTNATAPDLCWVRRSNVKYGVGLNLEQHLTPDVGVFFRGMVSDGQSEVDAFVSADRSMAFGVLAKGTPWHRHRDVTGVAASFAWISSAHAAYLARGGVDGFIGDGALKQATESVVEAFYSVSLLDAFWISLDFQHITNPAYNADRGPVEIVGARFHAEF